MIIAGNNQELLKRLRAQQWSLPVTVLGYVENMAEWMAASDLLVTTAGPGTLAEAACEGEADRHQVSELYASHA